MAESQEKDEENPPESASEALPSKVLYALEVLPTIKEAQGQHGLRHGDYQRYRQYCSRRLRRVRKSLSFVHGSRHRFHQKKLTIDVITDSKFLLLPLMNSERAWAYAMQLRQQANTESRKRFHMVRRLKKAAKHARALSQLCEADICDARTKLEAQAYSAWMNGNLNFEMREWQTALSLFREASTIYGRLSSALPTHKALYDQRVEEIVPNIRYCAYNIGDGSADIEELMKLRMTAGDQDLLAGKIDEVLAQSRAQQAETMKEITWHGQTVPVKNEKVRVFILRTLESDQEIVRAETFEQKMELYDSLLMACKDAQQVIRDELKTDADKTKRSHKNEAQVANMEFLLSYISFIRLSKTIDRNLLMAQSLQLQMESGKTTGQGKTTKPDDLVRLYDILIQNVSDLSEIPQVQDDAQLSQEVAAQNLAFRAHRAFFVAESYRLLKKWEEATALYDRVIARTTSAIEQYKLGASSSAQEALAKLQEVEKQARGRKCITNASAILEMKELEEKMGAVTMESPKPLLERLDDYCDDPSLFTSKPNVIPFPPDFEPVPCKPLFFDLALNHVEFPSLDEKMEKKRGAGGGITGFVKGLFWGSSSK
ncbi:signal recognition particle subunit SRP68-like [Oscarella lobularis]|uniref:signal recognition particle subunit SRP68-like n=1 Tax=Oscarella lobularis TaxID=121494 RepID=UPI0033143DED